MSRSRSRRTTGRSRNSSRSRKSRRSRSSGSSGSRMRRYVDAGARGARAPSCRRPGPAAAAASATRSASACICSRVGGVLSEKTSPPVDRNADGQ